MTPIHIISRRLYWAKNWLRKYAGFALYCYKCKTWFVYDPDKPWPRVIMCPECVDHGYGLVGILHRKRIRDHELVSYL